MPFLNERKEEWAKRCDALEERRPTGKNKVVESHPPLPPTRRFEKGRGGLSQGEEKTSSL